MACRADPAYDLPLADILAYVNAGLPYLVAVNCAQAVKVIDNNAVAQAVCAPTCPHYFARVGCVDGGAGRDGQVQSVMVRAEILSYGSIDRPHESSCTYLG